MNSYAAADLSTDSYASCAATANMRSWLRLAASDVDFTPSFLLARYPSELSKVMQIIHRAISTHIINKAGFTTKQAKTGAVTLIQRFGSALNLNIHFHMLFLEGAISENTWGGTTFTRINTQRTGT